MSHARLPCWFSPLSAKGTKEVEEELIITSVREGEEFGKNWPSRKGWWEENSSPNRPGYSLPVLGGVETLKKHEAQSWHFLRLFYSRFPVVPSDSLLQAPSLGNGYNIYLWSKGFVNINTLNFQAYSGWRTDVLLHIKPPVTRLMGLWACPCFQNLQSHRPWWILDSWVDDTCNNLRIFSLISGLCIQK